MNTQQQEYQFSEQKVLWIQRYSAKLMSFAIERPKGFRFTAGQFTKLGFFDGKEYVWRAYSMISPEQADYLAFYVILIEDGVMSLHFNRMRADDKLLLDNRSIGFFTLDRVPPGKQLVMLATGSGIAPFLSMLSEQTLWRKAEKIVLVHSVSYAQDLVFKEKLAQLTQDVAGHFVYQPVVTRETVEGALSERILPLLQNGRLAQTLGFPFTVATTRFLICGNPDMVKDSYEYLKSQGFALHRIHKDGQIMMEHAF
ncbi:ferredoxin--NADP reductase [Pasteurellaceae bacterium LIM206]|nr:ferredoxin--NADP reductase [Pasteurellaceae bacterium LIM206]